MRLIAAAAAIVLALLAAGGGPAAAGQPGGDVAMRLDLAELSPRVVTSDGPSVLTVTGTLRNTGDVPVRDIGVRLQRGDPLRTEAAVRDALAGDAATDAGAPQFQELPDALAPGADAPVRLTVPLRGAPETGLALSATGVYELLVNVNGAPEGGARARLAAVRMLLPVLGLPAGPDGSDPVPAAGERPVPVSVLLPLADQPRRLSTVPGSPALLSDDVLATEFGPEGRLGGLVTALAQAPAAAREAVCVAVDPDLVQTAAAMRAEAGYEVLLPDGSRVPGTGAGAAGSWLDAVAAAVAGRCLLALPFADADLVALTRADLGDLAAEAVDEGRDIVEETLGTPVLAGVTWPADGVVDDATAGAIAADAGTLVLSGTGLDRPAGGVVPVAGGTALVADPLLTTAADPAPATRAGRGGGAAAVPAAAGGALATQDLLGTLTFRASGSSGSDDLSLLAPPHRWTVDGAAAAALFDGVAALADAGAVIARPVGTLAAEPDGPARELVYPLDAGAAEVAPSATATIRDALADLDDLRSSAVDSGPGIDPDDLFAPLRLDTVRAASAAWRGSPALADAAARSAADRVAAIRGAVSVLEPPTPFSLGTSDSPLLLTVANGLPVTMRVRVELASTSGLRVAPIPVVELPPLGRRQVQANAEVLRSGVFTVDAAVLTEAGGRLGPPSRLQVRSTAYGTITLWLTGTAGALLVVLAARRILRRNRTEPGTPGRTAPAPDQGTPDRETPSPETAPTPASPVPPTPNRPPTPAPPLPPEDSAGWTTVPVRLPGPSNAPIPRGPRTGPIPPARSDRASAPAGGPPGTPVAAPDPVTPPRPPGSP